MIKLEHLSLNNFMSHVSSDLNFNDYEGLVLIEGVNKSGYYSSNGSGKSTLLEGIIYALTGDTLRGVSVNDVVNRNYKKNTKVSLEFMKDDTIYLVDRYRKDDTRGDSLELHKNGEDISKRVNKETQKSLEDILSISYKILTSTTLLGEGLSSRFTQLSDPEKKSLIESTLNLNYDINKIRDSANSKLKELKLSLATIEGEISVLEELSNVNIELIEDSIHDLAECISIYQKTVDNLNIFANNLSVEIDAINPKITIITNTLSQYASLKRNRETLVSNYNHQNEELQRILSSATPVCTLCRQALESAESKEAVIKQFQDTLNNIWDDISKIDTELSTLPNEEVLQSKLSALSEEYKKKSAEYREIVDDCNRYVVKIAEAKKDIEQSKSTIESASDCSTQVEQKMLAKENIQKEIEKYDYFYKLFSPTGIIVNILSEAVDYINTRLSVYSNILLEKDYKINFVKGKISLVDSKGASYQSLSNGEKRRLDISIQFALHDYVSMYCGMKLDCCFIDEILDTLDDIGVENIFEVLRLKLEYCQLRSIYVITHNSALKNKFDRVITVCKDEKGDSYLQ